jgi:murein L,D-transpeptidase YafK
MAHIRHSNMQLEAHLFQVQSSKCSYKSMCIQNLLEINKKIFYARYTDDILVITITAKSGSTLTTDHLLTDLIAFQLSWEAHNLTYFCRFYSPKFTVLGSVACTYLLI